jgi:hypothetical protein
VLGFEPSTIAIRLRRLAAALRGATKRMKQPLAAAKRAN